MGIIQGYTARATMTLNSTVTTMPALPGVSFQMPKNYNIPTFLTGNNAYQITAVEGLQFPTANMILGVTQGWFNAANMTSWLARTSNDAASLGEIDIYDGASGMAVSNAKLSDFSIGATQGEMVRFSARFMGSVGATLSTPPSGSVLTDTPAAFQHTGYASTSSWVAAGVVSWDLSYNNNLMPNPNLPSNETASATNVFPTEVNAGIPYATVHLVMQADATPPANGQSFTLRIKAPGATSSTYINCKNPLLMTPAEYQFQMPRQLRAYDYVLLGDTSTVGTIAPPITFTTAGS